jgi:hypothetical protein
VPPGESRPTTAGRPGLTMTGRAAAWLLPPIHGTYATHAEEWRAYGRHRWGIELGRRLKLLATGPLLFYSPYLWTGCRCTGLRRLLGSCGLASGRYYVFRK